MTSPLPTQLGFQVAFVAERHYLTTYRCQASSVWLGAASQRTTQMRLGVLAHTLPITPPVRLAEEIALLDQFTGGRIEVGVGLGHRVEELVANHVDPADRITIFQERLAIMEGLWAGGTVTYESEHTRLTDVFIHPPTVQQPHPPLWFAGTHANCRDVGRPARHEPGDRLRARTNSSSAPRRRSGTASAIRQTRNLAEDEVRRGRSRSCGRSIVG